MQIGVIGTNHKSSDLEFRERFAKACARRFATNFSDHPDISYVLLSTCNRTEIYFHSNDLPASHSYILRVLRNDIPEEFEHRLYSYFGGDAFLHLARVTAGMDSAIILESEIQGQVKVAYEKTSHFRQLSRELHFLFQKCLKIGKNVRSTKPLPKGMPDLAETVFHTAENLFGDLQRKKTLFVGVSEINLKIYSFFKGLKEITFCNRTLEKAEAIAKAENLSLLPWERLKEWQEYDIVIFGTKAPNFLIRKEAANPIPLRKKLVIDLSVPRNVDPRIGSIEGFHLLDVDKLNLAIDSKKKIKAIEIERIETQIIARAVEKQVLFFRLKEEMRLQELFSFVS